MSNSKQPEPRMIGSKKEWPREGQSSRFPNWEEILLNLMKDFPEITHYRVGENESACMRGGDRTIVDNWGQHLTDDRSLVGCQPCLEWMHA